MDQHASGSAVWQTRRQWLIAQEQPGLEVYQPQPPSAPMSDTASTLPEKYWSEEGTQSNFTFYREGSPTPDSKRDKTLSGSWATAAAVAKEIEPPPHHDDDASTICGLKRRMFWILLAVVALLVIGIAVGVGAGVGASKSSSSANRPVPVNSTTASATSSLLSTSTDPAATISSSSSTTTSSSSAAATTSYLTDCPAQNNTYYNVPGSTKRFFRTCGVDYSGPDEAIDLSHVQTNSMQGCMNNCAGTENCTGCGWGFIDGDAGKEHRCWLKNKLQKPHSAAPDWCFAILVV